MRLVGFAPLPWKRSTVAFRFGGSSSTLPRPQVVSPSSNLSTRERLRALVESDVRWAREHDAFARVLIREALSGDSRFAPQVLEAAAPWFAKLTEVLEAGVERGEIRRGVPVDQLALSVTGLINLALVQHWGSSGAWPSFADIADIVLRQFLEGAQPSFG